MVPRLSAGLTVTPAVETDSSVLSLVLLQGCFLLIQVGSVEEKELG